VLRGFRAYQDARGPDKGKKGEQADKAARDPYAEAFLKAFHISSALAEAMSKGRAKVRPADQEALDAYGPAFVRAYERAKALKEVLQERKAAGDQQGGKALEALDRFLQSGKEFEQAVKRRAKAQAVEQAKRAIEGALAGVGRTAHDKRTELETLEEIERVVKDLKKKIQGKGGGK
jgi:hypothetical protein